MRNLSATAVCSAIRIDIPTSSATSALATNSFNVAMWASRGLECTAFVRRFVQVFVLASARPLSGFLGFEIDEDASFAIVATLPRPAPTDGLLARGFCRDVETLGKLAVRQPGFSQGNSPYRRSFACTTGRLTNSCLLHGAR